MAQQALGAGMTVPRRRALFGLLDADGWGWASVKAFVWLIIIIFMLGYLPDRAYYLTVGRTVDLGRPRLVARSTSARPTNETLPCPAPVGALVPVAPVTRRSSPCPPPRTDGAVLQVGTKLLYIGGSDGTTAQSTVYVARTVGTGNFDTWAERTRPARAACGRERRLRGRQHLRDRWHRRRRVRRPTTVYVLTPEQRRPAPSASGRRHRTR